MDTLTKVKLRDVNLQDCLRKAVPMVIETPATWGLEELQGILRTARLAAYRFPRKGPQCARHDADHETITLDEFICTKAEDARDTERARKIISNLEETVFANLTTLFPAVHEHLLAPCRRDYRNLWVNRKGDGTALHYDLPVGFNLQLFGAKTYYFCAPGTRGRYPYSWLSAKGHCSRIPNVADVDRAQFPRFHDVQPLFAQVMVKQGDVMLMPSCWWHQVDSHGELNINLTWGWVDRSCVLKHPRQTAAGLATYFYRKLFYPHIY